ncbi:chorismate-binding protein [Cupriavidus respiraculi]|uniref:Isochorismate synthase MenF n=1 Tax=Cupriavidus respiraculi TaxID=195930 RepID=A0ABM8XAS8_9BURK|nr:bifunctional anthranilate synthase component I family protein/class IV aminotransferase [Cupriavidus respiraculi]CAG9177120.1 Isochorismate synthase MenF [Cupriavidus respiraculi]
MSLPSPSPLSADALPSLSGDEPFLLLDDAVAPDGARSSRLHTGYVRMDRIRAGAVEEVDDRLRAGWEAGWHAGLLVPYEFGAPLVRAPSLAAAREAGGMPFQDGALCIVWFERLCRLDASDVSAWLRREQDARSPAGTMQIRSDTGADAFHAAIARIHAWIEAGDTYQVNYTQRLRFDTFGDPIALYAALRAVQPVPYGALARLPGDQWVLSLSPELFVRHDGKGELLARPMKGTAPRSGDAARDARAAAALAADAKNRAENVMIVDLLRNDLGRIAEPGSVAVPDRFTVQPFGQVLQMTSTVTARATPDVTPAGLLGALFPCGSITGAPKRRTMEIIAQLERAPRGLYTGSIGWIAPPLATGGAHGGLGPATLSVAIRTLVLGAQRPDGLRPGEMGVGAGIVHDSVAADEYAECGWKAGFLTRHDPGFSLFETMRAQDGDVPRLDAHLARLAASASCLGFPFDPVAARRATLAHAATLGAGTFRLRLSLDKGGRLQLGSGALAPLPSERVRLLLAHEPLPVADPLRRHKTSARGVYDAGWQAAERAGAFDSLFFNTRGELLEGGRSSVFVRIDGRWLTPPLTMDILPGVMRGAVLADGARWLGGEAGEAVVTREMLANAEAVAVVNGLRGVMQAALPAAVQAGA